MDLTIKSHDIIIPIMFADDILFVLTEGIMVF